MHDELLHDICGFHPGIQFAYCYYSGLYGTSKWSPIPIPREIVQKTIVFGRFQAEVQT